MNMAFFRIFQRKPKHGPADLLYAGLVAQARLPAFFLAGGVPDSVDGRFDMIALHAFLVLRRLSGPGASTAETGMAQRVFDVMFADMDRNLREMGVGDLAVGAKIRAMLEAFYGRVAAYETGLAAAGDSVLADALARNLYRGATPMPGQLSQTAAYLRREAGGLTGNPAVRLLAGQISFGPPPAYDGA